MCWEAQANKFLAYRHTMLSDAQADHANVWRLFNWVTHALKGRVMDNPAATPRLHQILDGVCDKIHASHTLISLTWVTRSR
jgi:hypothetical protein